MSILVLEIVPKYRWSPTTTIAASNFLLIESFSVFLVRGGAGIVVLTATVATEALYVTISSEKPTYTTSTNSSD